MEDLRGKLVDSLIGKIGMIQTNKLNKTNLTIKTFPRLHSEKIAPSGQLSMPKLELQLYNRDKPASGS
jgi:hypothetical protein